MNARLCSKEAFAAMTGVSTRVQLPDGGGVLLGGLRSEQVDKSQTRVPYLSAVPVVGYPCAAAYLRQSLCYARRKHPDLAEDPRPLVARHDHALCAPVTRSPARRFDT